MNTSKKIAGWFEIPVADMERALKFYEEVFRFKMIRNKMGVLDMAFFPGSTDPQAAGAAGSLVYHPEFYNPSPQGTLIYLSSQERDLSVELNRVEAAGGSIYLQKKQIALDIGYMGVMIDSEGNRIALHSWN